MSKTDKIRELAAHTGALRPRDLHAQGTSFNYLSRLEAQGEVVRSGRGLYTHVDADITEHHSLMEASIRVPRGVICLLSALRFHDLTTQDPHEVWLAIGSKDWRPRVDYPPLRIVRFGVATFEYGIETHEIEGAKVRVYSVAKTIADCFKYRNKIGVDVAVEALAECWRTRRASPQAIWEAARICRVANVMRPYIEAMQA